jgi:hypothetical protein
LVRDGETFTYEWVYGVEVVEGFEFEVEHSSDLEEWIASEASPDLSEDGKLRILLTSPDQKRFVRVRVKRAE